MLFQRRGNAIQIAFGDLDDFDLLQLVDPLVTTGARGMASPYRGTQYLTRLSQPPTCKHVL